MNTSRTSLKRRQSGSVFVMALAIMVVLTSLALVLSRTMYVEASSSSNYVARLQAQSVANGAVAYLRKLLEGNDGTMPDAGEESFRAVQVGDGFFWVIKRDYQGSGTYAFGLVDEEGKFNLNGVELEVLANLPGMTYELAAGIIDWRDENEEVESGGAESSYYLSLEKPYQAKNDLFESVAELLLVKDITPEIFYGEDTNANGVLDPNENDGDESDPPDNRDGQLDYGLSAYVTVYNSQAVLDADGQTRVNVNTGNQLASVLSEVVPPNRLGDVMGQVMRGRPFQNLIDFYYRTGLQQAEFERIEDKLTMGAEQSRAQVNINTAPRQVLAAMPGMTDSDVEAIISKRESGTPFEKLSDVISVISRDRAIAIGGLIKTKSYRYSADIVAVDGQGRSFVRLQVVFDAQTTPPRVLYIRDVTSLGWPLDPQILADLKEGIAPNSSMILSSSQTGAR